MRGVALYVLCALVCVYLTPTAGQLFEDPKKTYKNMTFQWDVRLRGGIDLPHCIKRLMNCWEVIKPELLCLERSAFFESVCMVMKSPFCHDLRPFGIWGDWNYNYNYFEMYAGACRHDWHTK